MSADPAPVVVDASVVVDWILGGPGADRALALAPLIRARAILPRAPDIWMAECANAVWKHVRLKHTLAPDPGLEAVNGLARTGIAATPTLALIPRAFPLAVERGCSVYDALYLALAAALDAPLATGDATLSRHARASGVRLYWE